MAKQSSSQHFWIQKALAGNRHKHPFNSYCHRHHMKGASKKCISSGLHSKSALTRRRASLAKTLEGFHK